MTPRGSVRYAPPPIEVLTPPLELRGGNFELFDARDPEILAAGPAGTGKTRTILELINMLCHTFPGLRVLIVRKREVSLSRTCLVTLRTKVYRDWSAHRSRSEGVRFFGGSKDEPAAFRYENGSEIMVGGMDDPTKVLSSEYDLIYANEATELSLEDWETLKTRLRAGTLEHQRIIADCNPTYSKHWLKLRCDRGACRMIVSTLRDNPEYYDAFGVLTPKGAAYLRDQLGGLTGSRRRRLLDGDWIGVDNAIYPHFERALHVRPLEEGLRWIDGAIGVDYGRRHKCAAIAIKVDQYGRRWVVEAWGEPANDHGRELMRQVGRMRNEHRIYRGRTDPNQDPLAGMLGFSVADGAPGSRNRRTHVAGRLFNIWPGGIVPTLSDDVYDLAPPMVAAREDCPGLLFVEGAPGIEELCDQIEAYHEVEQVSDTRSEFVVARIDEDFVAGMEYGLEELADVVPFPVGVASEMREAGSRQPGADWIESFFGPQSQASKAQQRDNGVGGLISRDRGGRRALP